MEFFYLYTLLLCYAKINGQNIVDPSNKTITVNTEDIQDIFDFAPLPPTVNSEGKVRNVTRTSFENIGGQENIDLYSSMISSSSEENEDIDDDDSKIVPRKGVGNIFPETKPTSSVSARKGVVFIEDPKINTTESSSISARKGVVFIDDTKTNVGDISSISARKGVVFNEDATVNVTDTEEGISKNVNVSEVLAVSDKTTVDTTLPDDPEYTINKVKEISHTDVLNITNANIEEPNIVETVNSTNLSEPITILHLNTTTIAPEDRLNPVKPIVVPSNSTRSTPTEPSVFTPAGWPDIYAPLNVSIFKDVRSEKTPVHDDKTYRNGAGYGAVVITILILVSLLGLIGFVGYKRIHAFWYRRHYARVDFLIDGMYD